jgi:hypothetical protein
MAKSRPDKKRPKAKPVQPPLPEMPPPDPPGTARVLPMQPGLALEPKPAADRRVLPMQFRVGDRLPSRKGTVWHELVWPMETNEISMHLFRVYAFVRDQMRWVTAHEIEIGADVAPRTARAHALRLVKAGIFDQLEVFRGHRYRLAAKADKRNLGFVQRLEQASEVFGPKAK